jgi:hypothetical protein
MHRTNLNSWICKFDQPKFLTSLAYELSGYITKYQFNLLSL